MAPRGAASAPHQRRCWFLLEFPSGPRGDTSANVALSRHLSGLCGCFRATGEGLLCRRARSSTAGGPYRRLCKQVLLWSEALLSTQTEKTNRGAFRTQSRWPTTVAVICSGGAAFIY